jgi:hypothetical protein
LKNSAASPPGGVRQMNWGAMEAKIERFAL